MTEEPSTAVLKRQRRSVTSHVLAVASTGLCLLVEGATLASRHWLSRAIDEFGMDVSGITRFAIGPLFPTLLAIVILAAIGKLFIVGRSSSDNKWSLVTLLAGLICLVIYIVGVLMPLFSLMNSLS